MQIKKPAQTKQVMKFPYTEEYGAGRPILIHSESGYPIQYTNRHAEIMLLTDQGWRTEKLYDLLDTQTGLKAFQDMKEKGAFLRDNIKEHMSETKKPLVVTNTYKKGLKIYALELELEKETAHEKWKEEQAKRKKENLSLKKVQSIHTSSQTQAALNKDSASTASSIAKKITVSKTGDTNTTSYEEKKQALEEGMETAETELGEIFSYNATEKKYKNWPITNLFNYLFSSKKNTNDNLPKNDM